MAVRTGLVAISGFVTVLASLSHAVVQAQPPNAGSNTGAEAEEDGAPEEPTDDTGEADSNDADSNDADDTDTTDAADDADNGSAGEPGELAALRQELLALSERVTNQERELEALRSAATTSSSEEATDEETGEDAASLLAERHPIGRFPDDATIVTHGDFPGSIRIPDTGVSARIGGLVLVEAFFDFDSVGFADVVSPRTIPLDGSPDDESRQTGLSARNSRINFDVRRDTDVGPFRTFIEADFFGSGNELLSNYQFRLRHAIAQLGDFYFGQWWSMFADVASLPENSSLGGPFAAPTARQASARWARNIVDEWRVGISIENPEGDFFGPDEVLASDTVPDFSGHVLMDYSWLRFRVAGLFRRLETQSDERFAGGVNVSGRLPLPFLGEDANLAFQFQYGEGIARYYGGFAGAGLDGIVDMNGTIDPVRVIGGYLAYQHWWTDRWRSTVTASLIDFDLPSSAAGETFKRGGFYAVNLFWSPVDGATFGMDVLYATRETLAGDKGSGIRVHTSARFDF
ncbi:MAG: DcaP family trimeric outer membrane transporter [Myxococcota bacterium]